MRSFRTAVPRKARLIPAFTILAVAGQPQLARAQGTVLHAFVGDANTGDFVRDAEVTVAPVGLKATTDFSGDTRFSGLKKGRYTVSVRRLGYAPLDTDLLVTGRDSAEITFMLRPVSHELETVTVEESAVSPFLKEFEQRRKQGTGQYITDSTLRASFGSSLPNIIASRIRGLRYVTLPGGGFSFYSLRGTNSLSSGSCPIAVYWNGLRLATTSAHGSTDASLVPVDFIGGVEFYNAGAVPVQYQSPGNDCGVLLLWPRP